MTEASQPPAAQPHDTAIKETIESIVIAFILAFVFRAFVVEAFVIPTGSMAPTLLGQHVQLVCPQCGYEFVSGPRDASTSERRSAATYQGKYPADGKWIGNALEINCPMCDYPIVMQTQLTRAGDRILVLKYLYQFSEPRRWDVVVFRNPVDPADNYIKRLIGLPEEWLWIIRGNIFTSKDEGQSWQIQRKPVKVQEAVWQPVYHSRYVPLDGGKPGEVRENPWQSPWHIEAGAIEPVNEGTGYAYATDSGAGRLNFAFDRRSGSDYYPYNDLPSSGQSITTYVEELRVGVSVRPEQSGGGITLKMRSELAQAEAGIDAEGRTFLRFRRSDVEDWNSFTGEPTPLPVGHTTRVELWHADQSVQLWMGGKLIHAFDYDVPIEPLRQMGEPTGPPTVGIEVAGAPMRLSRVDLDRDLYYTQTPNNNALATHDYIAKISADEFFCLGDNSPASSDSRLWTSVNDWILYHTAEHKHLAPDGQTMLPGVATGIVARKLMIGRAFFVYWPGPYGFSPTSMNAIPNFGQLRFIK